MTELDIYRILLARAAVLPHFMVIEASYSPDAHPRCLSQEARSGHAQVSGNFNRVKALTAGFEEPWAFSILAGNVVNFYYGGGKDTKGLGYSAYLISSGNYQIKDNEQTVRKSSGKYEVTENRRSKN